MLPTKVLAEAVAFLCLFDLKTLAVNNAPCSSLAVKASTVIRWEEFPGLHFVIANHSIGIFRCFDSSKYDAKRRSCRVLVANLTFPNETATSESIAAAFPSCIF